jgi:CubicO group peptidase (beta-lactamase class C family)
MLPRTLPLVLALLMLPAKADTQLQAIAKGSESTPELSGLQVSLMRRGEAAESVAFGFAQRPDAGPIALRQDHKVRVASISKLVVAIGVMRLVETGQLDLDADVSQFLGWQLRNPTFPDQPITARQLLSHTSSIRDASVYFIAAGTGELRDFFKPGSRYWESGAHFATEANQGPGQYFEYSNLNFGVLATLIELLSQERFDRYMARHILEPMGLTASFNPCDIPDARRAAAFRKRAADATDWHPDGPWVAQVDAGEPRCFYGMRDSAQATEFLAHYELGSNATLFSPQGGLRASADDLLAVLRMLAARGEIDGRRILSTESVSQMIAPVWNLNDAGSNGLSSGEAEPGGTSDGLMSSYGLSVHRIDLQAWGFDRGPTLVLGHLGEAYGVLSYALFDPETGDGIASIITGTADDPSASSSGHSPLYRVEEEILAWWLRN